MSLIQRIFDEQIARQAEDTNNAQAQEDLNNKVASLEAREAHCIKMELALKKLQTDYDNKKATLHAEKETSESLRKKLEESKGVGRGGVIDQA